MPRRRDRGEARDSIGRVHSCGGLLNGLNVNFLSQGGHFWGEKFELSVADSAGEIYNLCFGDATELANWREAVSARNALEKQDQEVEVEDGE